MASRPRRGTVLAIVNLTTVLLWFVTPTIFLVFVRPRDPSVPGGDPLDAGAKFLLWSAGSISFILVLATFILARRQRPNDVIINISIQLLLLATAFLGFLYFCISILAFVPAPALLLSLWGLTRPPPRPLSM